MSNSELIRKKILEYLHYEFQENHQKYTKGKKLLNHMKEISDEVSVKGAIRYLEDKNMIEVIHVTGEPPITRITSKGIDFIEDKNEFNQPSTSQNINATNVQISYGDGSTNIINAKDNSNNTKFDIKVFDKVNEAIENQEISHTQKEELKNLVQEIIQELAMEEPSNKKIRKFIDQIKGISKEVLPELLVAIRPIMQNMLGF